MLLNEIPVLDKGYVALIDGSMGTAKYKQIIDHFYGAVDSPHLKKMCYAVLAFKAPIFVQMHLAQHGLTMLGTKLSTNDAYVPSIGEINSSSLENNKLISDDISRTTDALLINPSAYQTDGCDKFISQVIMPVSSYTTFIVGGTIDAWRGFYKNKSVPAPIRAYANTVKDIIESEWRDV